MPEPTGSPTGTPWSSGTTGLANSTDEGGEVAWRSALAEALRANGFEVSPPAIEDAFEPAAAATDTAGSGRADDAPDPLTAWSAGDAGGPHETGSPQAEPADGWWADAEEARRHALAQGAAPFVAFVPQAFEEPAAQPTANEDVAARADEDVAADAVAVAPEQVAADALAVAPEPVAADAVAVEPFAPDAVAVAPEPVHAHDAVAPEPFAPEPVHADDAVAPAPAAPPAPAAATTVVAAGRAAVAPASPAGAAPPLPPAFLADRIAHPDAVLGAPAPTAPAPTAPMQPAPEPPAPAVAALVDDPAPVDEPAAAAVGDASGPYPSTGDADAEADLDGLRAQAVAWFAVDASLDPDAAGSEADIVSAGADAEALVSDLTSADDTPDHGWPVEDVGATTGPVTAWAESVDADPMAAARDLQAPHAEPLPSTAWSTPIPVDVPPVLEGDTPDVLDPLRVEFVGYVERPPVGTSQAAAAPAFTAPSGSITDIGRRPPGARPATVDEPPRVATDPGSVPQPAPAPAGADLWDMVTGPAAASAADSRPDGRGSRAATLLLTLLVALVIVALVVGFLYSFTGLFGA